MAKKCCFLPAIHNLQVQFSPILCKELLPGVLSPTPRITAVQPHVALLRSAVALGH